MFLLFSAYFGDSHSKHTNKQSSFLQAASQRPIFLQTPDEFTRNARLTVNGTPYERYSNLNGDEKYYKEIHGELVEISAREYERNVGNELERMSESNSVSYELAITTGRPTQKLLKKAQDAGIAFEYTRYATENGRVTCDERFVNNPESKNPTLKSSRGYKNNSNSSVDGGLKYIRGGNYHLDPEYPKILAGIVKERYSSEASEKISGIFRDQNKEIDQLKQNYKKTRDEINNRDIDQSTDEYPEFRVPVKSTHDNYRSSQPRLDQYKSEPQFLKNQSIVSGKFVKAIKVNGMKEDMIYKVHTIEGDYLFVSMPGTPDEPIRVPADSVETYVLKRV